MNGVLQMVCLTFLILYGGVVAHAGDKTPEDYSLCTTCHRGIEKLDENHDFSCEKCHLLPENRQTPLTQHEPIVRYPGSPLHSDLFCGPCHQKELSNIKNSLHYTLAGMINQTRFLWGAQPDPTPQYGARDHAKLLSLPDSPSVIQTPANLVDDLLRRRCLACHPGVKPAQKRGLYRGVGCSACHVLYSDDGIYRGKDRIMAGKKGYPTAHRFCKPIPVVQCLHCHNGPYVGADYAGRFQHDFHQSYRTPIINGYLPQQIYVMDHHRLKSDVHHKKGLLCVDCHDQGDVMGRGPLYGWQQEAVAIRCNHCHGPFEKDAKTDTHRAITDGVFRSKEGGRHKVPRQKRSVAAHNIPQMKNVHCTGCHAAWGFMDYGPSLLRDDRENLSRWSPWRIQGDTAVADLFDIHGRFLGKTDKYLAGPWFLGWRFRRWEYLTLGKDNQGRIVPFRPRYQYRISFVNHRGQVILDSVVPERGDGSGAGWAFMPFYPHTIQKRGRACEACHGQTVAAGMGLWEGHGRDLALTRPSPPVYSSLKLLSETEKRKLIEKTQAYRKWRFKILWQDYEH